jgi:hypothetical protein
MGNDLTSLARRLQPLIRHPEGGGEAGDFNLQRIHLLDRSAGVSYDYEAADANIDIAIAASEPGDIIFLPAGTFTQPHTFPAGVEIVGFGEEHTILTGVITIEGAEDTVTAISRLSILVTGESEEDSIVALWGPEEGELRIHECHIKGENTYEAVDEEEDEIIRGMGYGIAKQNGDIYMEGGWLEGTTSPLVIIPDSSEPTDWRDSYEWSSPYPVVERTPYSITTDHLLYGSATYKIKPGLSVPPDKPADPPIYVHVDSAVTFGQVVPGPDGDFILYHLEIGHQFDPVLWGSWVTLMPCTAGPPGNPWTSAFGSIAGSANGIPVLTKSARARGYCTHFGIGPNHSRFGYFKVRFSLYSNEELEELEREEFLYPGFYVSAVRIEPTVAGHPVWNDRGAFDTKWFPERHAQDILDQTFTYHKNPDDAGYQTLANAIIRYRQHHVAEVYEFSAQGLNEAIDDATAQDHIEIKGAGSLFGADIIFKPDIKVFGNENIVLAEKVWGASGAKLSNVKRLINGDTNDEIVGVYGGTEGVFSLDNCIIQVTNTTGDAFGLSAERGGNIEAANCSVEGVSAYGSGYAGRSISGRIRVLGGGFYYGSTDAFLIGG